MYMCDGTGKVMIVGIQTQYLKTDNTTFVASALCYETLRQLKVLLELPVACLFDQAMNVYLCHLCQQILYYQASNISL